MLRVGVLLSAAAFAAQAVTIVDISGPPDPEGAYIDSTQQLAVGFTIAETYKNVTISAFLWGFGTFPYNAYLTTRIGPGTDPFKDQVARWNGNTPKGPSGLVPIFTGLTLIPATYYLTLYAENQPGGVWTFTNDPHIITAPGASADFQAGHYDATSPEYPPAANYGPIQGPGRWIFSVESLESAAIPEPSTVFAGLVAVVFCGYQMSKATRPLQLLRTRQKVSRQNHAPPVPSEGELP